MRMAVVAEEVVHSRTVEHTGLGNGLVPFMSTALDEHGVQWQVPGGPTKAHVILGDVVGPGKVANYATGHGDSWKGRNRGTWLVPGMDRYSTGRCTHMSDEGEEPCEDRNRCPDNAEGVSVGVKVYRSSAASVAINHRVLEAGGVK